MKKSNFGATANRLRELASAAERSPNLISDSPTDRESNKQSNQSSIDSSSSVRLDWLTLQSQMSLDDFERFVTFLQICLQDEFLDYPDAGGRVGTLYGSHILSVGRSTYIAYSLVQDDESDEHRVRFAIQFKGRSLSVFPDLASQLLFLGQLFPFGDFNCSRLDIALDDWAYGAGDQQVSPRFFYAKSPQNLVGFRKFALIDSEGYFTEKGSLSTVHLGSRFSAKFMRIYQKVHDTSLYGLRYELENKDKSAKNAWTILQEFARAYLSFQGDQDLMQRLHLEASYFLRGMLFGSFDFVDRAKSRTHRNNYKDELGIQIFVQKSRAIRCDWWQSQLDRLLDGAEPVKFYGGRIPSSLAATLAWIKRSVVGKLSILRSGLGDEQFIAFLLRETDHYISRLDPQKLAEFRTSVEFLGRSLTGEAAIAPDAHRYPCPAGVEEDDWQRLVSSLGQNLLTAALRSPGLAYLQGADSDPYDLI